jgi:NAD(P)-dependent dehydrogenase (short-subunit alcohol dehydrogenase family)
VQFTTAVVTGAAGGIGRALAVRVGSAASRLVLADVDAAALADTAGELGASAVPTDVSDPRAMEALAAAAPDAELVCLNAGIVGTAMGPPWEVGPEEWDAVFAVNVGGVVNGLRAFVPRLLASGRPGHILITASLAGLATFPGGGAYGASKHAVVAVAEQAALALAGTAVGVTVLCPALVRTAMSAVGVDPADVADEALAAVAAGRFVVVPGEWRAAVVQRGERLAEGRPPVPPAPDGA